MISDNNAALITPIGAGSPAGLPGAVATPGPSTLHLLVIDDDPGILGMLASALLGEGYRVTCAEDGERGWEELCGSSFDGMITDHAMPRLSGLDLLRRVRAGPSRLPVILISGAMPRDDADFERLLSPGVAIDKPFDLRELLVTVQSTFGGPHYSDVRGGGGVGCTTSRAATGRWSRHAVR